MSDWSSTIQSRRDRLEQELSRIQQKYSKQHHSIDSGRAIYEERATKSVNEQPKPSEKSVQFSSQSHQRHSLPKHIQVSCHSDIEEMGKDDSPNSLLDMAPTDEKSTEKDVSKSLLYEFDRRFDKLEG